MIIVELEEQIDYYELNPPSALAGMGINAIDDVDWEFTVREDTANAVFELVCRCANTLFEVTGWIEGNDVTPPISVLCTSCGYQHVIHDPNIHGWDAILGEDGDPWVHGPGARPDRLVSEDVDVIPHQVLLRYEYPAELLEDGEHDGVERDCYTMITVLAHDPETGDLGLIFEDDCS